jgi:hypothetical protein
VAKIAMLRHSVPAFGTRWIAALSFRGIGKSSALPNAQACRLRSEEQSILPPINQDFKSGQFPSNAARTGWSKHATGHWLYVN